MPLHVGKGRNISTAIADIIDYVENPQKTDFGKFVYGYECDTRLADAEFLLSKRQYEQYALGEIDLETYRERKAVYDAELVQAKNVHAAITAQTKQIQSDYEARLKQREIVQEVDSAGTLTQALIDRLINKVYIFPGDRIEIEYVTQDFLATAEP